MKTFSFYHQCTTRDCGPACLKMIAAFYGINYDYQQMFNEKRINEKGTSLFDICEAAEKIDLIPVAFQTKLELLNCMKLPVILHWNQSHFVVLFEIENNEYHIADPANGLWKISESELTSHWQYIGNEGIVLTFSVAPYFFRHLD